MVLGMLGAIFQNRITWRIVRPLSRVVPLPKRPKWLTNGGDPNTY